MCAVLYPPGYDKKTWFKKIGVSASTVNKTLLTVDLDKGQVWDMIKIATSNENRLEAIDEEQMDFFAGDPASTRALDAAIGFRMSQGADTTHQNMTRLMKLHIKMAKHNVDVEVEHLKTLTTFANLLAKKLPKKAKPSATAIEQVNVHIWKIFDDDRKEMDKTKAGGASFAKRKKNMAQCIDETLGLRALLPRGMPWIANARRILAEAIFVIAPKKDVGGPDLKSIPRLKGCNVYDADGARTDEVNEDYEPLATEGDGEAEFWGWLFDHKKEIQQEVREFYPKDPEAEPESETSAVQVLAHEMRIAAGR